MQINFIINRIYKHECRSCSFNPLMFIISFLCLNNISKEKSFGVRLLNLNLKILNVHLSITIDYVSTAL